MFIIPIRTSILLLLGDSGFQVYVYEHRSLPVTLLVVLVTCEPNAEPNSVTRAPKLTPRGLSLFKAAKSVHSAGRSGNRRARSRRAAPTWALPPVCVSVFFAATSGEKDSRLRRGGGMRVGGRVAWEAPFGAFLCLRFGARARVSDEFRRYASIF